MADALHRPLDGTGQAVWGQALAQGVGRSQVTDLIFQSGEFRGRLLDSSGQASAGGPVQGYYENYLHRKADANGLAYFLAVLENGRTQEQVLADLLGSDEYFSRV